MFYSPTTNGFYTLEIHGSNIPADSVEITAEQYAALLQGQSEGKQIVPDENGFPILITPEVIPFVPNSITMRQCRLQLIADGVYATVNAAVEQMPLTAQIEWEYAATIDRSNPLVPAMQALLEWDDARVDQFYTQAALL